MKKSVKVRKIIFEILLDIHQKNNNFDDSLFNFTKNIELNEQEQSMIYNVVLNSIRKFFYIENILNKYLKKRTSLKIKTLLLSAITQLIYLDFKSYAVTNDTVEIAKIEKLNPSLINSLLRNVIKDIKINDSIKLNLSSVPAWFIKALNKNKINLYHLLEEVSNEPSLHLVFKNTNFLDNFNENIIRTTDRSAFVLSKKKIKDLNNYLKGDWWVQDFTSMLPIYLSPEFKLKKIIDLCAAPGGKAFQALSLNGKVTLNDLSVKRILKLKENLNRLNFNCKIINSNALNISEKKKFEVVILDSPCSGVGTIRRNPEILYKKNSPNLNFLIMNQLSLVNKASKLLKKKGILIYMVCSFLYDETKYIKDKFLNENKNFSQNKFSTKNNNLTKFIDNEGDINCIPTKFKNCMVDGFYAVKFVKND